MTPGGEAVASRALWNPGNDDSDDDGDSPFPKQQKYHTILARVLCRGWDASPPELSREPDVDRFGRRSRGIQHARKESSAAIPSRCPSLAPLLPLLFILQMLLPQETPSLHHERETQRESEEKASVMVFSSAAMSFLISAATISHLRKSANALWQQPQPKSMNLAPFVRSPSTPSNCSPEMPYPCSPFAASN